MLHILGVSKDAVGKIPLGVGDHRPRPASADVSPVCPPALALHLPRASFVVLTIPVPTTVYRELNT